MAKDKKTNDKLDVRTVFYDPVSGLIREECENSTRKHCQLVTHIVKQYFKEKGKLK